MLKWTRRGIGLILMLCLFARLLWGTVQLSTTADEPSHITSGYVFLARGMAGVWTVPERGHPLGVDSWLALPLWIAQPDISLESLSGWQADYSAFLDSFWVSLATPSQTLFAARVQAMFFTLLLAAVVWRWGRELWGPWAGLLALGILAFDPTLIAHGRLATNDVGATALGTWALYRAWCWTERPSWRRALSSGLLLALTMLAKSSGVLWGAAAGAMMLVTVACQWRGRRWDKDLAMQLPGQVLAAGLLALLLLWAAYGFSWGQLEGRDLALPAAEHWDALLFHPHDADNQLVFALGRRAYGRWWWYLPLAFAIKNPLPLLIALAIGLIALSSRKERPRLWPLAPFPALYVVAAMLVGKSIGYRYLLPIHPFIYLAIGGGLVQLGSQVSTRTWPRWALGAGSALLCALGMWYVITGARVYPYEIAYFSELIGGPEKGYRYLVDSNLAWGQAAGVRDVYLQAHPEARAEPPAHAYHPPPGRYVVNASYLQGIGTGDPYAYEWFRHRDPSAVLDYSLLVYDVPAMDVKWVAQCDVPRAPLDRASIVEGIGREDVRIVTFDCTRGWLFPGQEGEGIYVLHHDLVQEARGIWFASPIPTDPFIVRQVAWARLSFDQPFGNRGQPFVLYETLPRDQRAELLTRAISSGHLPVLLRALDRDIGPIVLDGPLVFLNGAVRQEKDVLEVSTLWKVIDSPVARPFSIMGHLVSADGTVIAGSDGLGISPLALAPGDLYVQRHRFSGIPEGDIHFQTGAYWLDTMEQWAVIGSPRVNALLFDPL